MDIVMEPVNLKEVTARITKHGDSLFARVLKVTGVGETITVEFGDESHSYRHDECIPYIKNQEVTWEMILGRRDN